MEDYSSAHSETVEELLDWPWKRFEAFYAAHLKRQAVAELQARKLALISGIWSNEGFNDDKGTRDETLEQLEEQFKEAERVIFMDRVEQERQQKLQLDQHRFTEEDESNPFLAPAIAATRGFDVPRDDEGRTAAEVVKSEYEIDQD